MYGEIIVMKRGMYIYVTSHAHELKKVLKKPYSNTREIFMLRIFLLRAFRSFLEIIPDTNSQLW